MVLTIAIAMRESNCVDSECAEMNHVVENLRIHFQTKYIPRKWWEFIIHNQSIYII